MEITKEQIEEMIRWQENALIKPYDFRAKFKEWWPEAFEPEIVESFLFKKTSAYRCMSDLVDTGVWKIFDAGDEFFIVHKDLKDAVQFPKESDGTDWDFMQNGHREIDTVDIEKIIKKIGERP